MSGDPASLIASLLDERAVSDANFARLTADDLAKPAMWAGYSVDAGFRMHRHASHPAEHTDQCGKVFTPSHRILVRLDSWCARSGGARRS